jgi:hypothetical protein
MAEGPHEEDLMESLTPEDLEDMGMNLYGEGFFGMDPHSQVFHDTGGSHQEFYPQHRREQHVWGGGGQAAMMAPVPKKEEDTGLMEHSCEACKRSKKRCNRKRPCQM